MRTIFTKNNFSKVSNQRGQAVMISLLVFMSVSLSTIFAVSMPVLEHIKIARSSYISKQNFYASESLTEDISYRLRNALPVSSSETLIVGDSIASASVVTVNNNKTIESTSQDDGLFRKVKATLTTTTGIAFYYGLQAGTGGFVMANNASVIGNVYANGNISGGTVTGTAIAANSAAQFADQTNTSSTTPTQSIIFRNTAGTQDFAQSFQVSTTSSIQKIQLYLKKVGSPADATVRIVTNNNGSPSTTNILSTQGTLSASLVTTNYGWIEIVLPAPAQLTASTTYWFVIDNSTQSTSNYYQIAANTEYINGTGKIGAYSGTWSTTSPSGLDGAFIIYLGGSYSSISNTSVGVDAWAHTITGGSVGGIKYCQSGSNCDTTKSDPSPQGYPISDANIAEWKDDALAGGTISSFTATSTSHLGPKKITGDLTINNNNTLYIDGAVWVVGNITVDNGATIRLPASFDTASGIIVSDGRVSIGNNSTFSGSGQTGSYIMVLTTSDCPTNPSCSGANAIELSNNGGAVLLNAQNGTLHISNNGGAKETIAKTILMDNGATVTYESGLLNANFSSGPGGTFSIDSWQEIE
jgi:hypothetical protein